MRIIRTTLFAVAALMLASATQASHYADLYVIPVAGHVQGVNGSVFMTDLSIQNFDSAPLTVELVFIESGEGNLDNIFPVVTGTLNGSVTVPARGSVRLQDVLSGYRGMSSAIGALLVGADRPFAVTSRAYTMGADGGTIGQTVPASANFLNVTEGATDLSTAVAYVPGLVQNDRYRTNLGLVVANATGFNGPLNVLVTLRNAAGETLGTRNVTVQAGAVTHLQFSARSVGEQDFDAGSAEFRITQGSGSVVAYGSVIDNRTTDAVFIEGKFPTDSSTMFGKGMFLSSPFRTLLQRFGSR